MIEAIIALCFAVGLMFSGTLSPDFVGDQASTKAVARTPSPGTRDLEVACERMTRRPISFEDFKAFSDAEIHEGIPGWDQWRHYILDIVVCDPSLLPLPDMDSRFAKQIAPRRLIKTGGSLGTVRERGGIAYRNLQTSFSRAIISKKDPLPPSLKLWKRALINLNWRQEKDGIPLSPLPELTLLDCGSEVPGSGMCRDDEKRLRSHLTSKPYTIGGRTVIPITILPTPPGKI